MIVKILIEIIPKYKIFGSEHNILIPKKITFHEYNVVTLMPWFKIRKSDIENSIKN